MKRILVMLLAATALAAHAEPPEPRPKEPEKKAVVKKTTKSGEAKKPQAKTAKTAKTTAAKKTVKKSPLPGGTTTRQDENKPAGEPPTEGPTAGQAKEKSPHGKPAVIETSQLAEFESLPDDRKKLIAGAITTARDSPWLPYLFGGSSPADGGFDCSGAMYYVMRQADLEPPRTSAEQYLWLQKHNGLIKVGPDVHGLDHPSLKLLKPGDLLFWGGTYEPTDGRQVNITHVALYLGHEKQGNRPVMINATDGRSYRGTKANGYGVYDFQLPREGSRTVFMGYGTPPGISETVTAKTGS